MRDDVFVAAGVYSGVVVLTNGLRVFGGYDLSWRRGSRLEPSHRAVVIGGYDEVEMHYMTIRAHEVTSEARVDQIEIDGPTLPAFAD